MYFVKIDQETSGKERDLPISSMEPTSSMSKVLTEEWKIFFFVVLFSVDNILWFFFKTVESYTKLNALNPTFNFLY